MSEKLLRLLMWAHYIYLLLLPTLAVSAAQRLFPGSGFAEPILIVGFPCVLMYTLFLANGYALPASLPLALLVVLIIPLQIALSVLLFGGAAKSVWIFFAESATVEIGAFVGGTLFSAFSARRADTPGGCFLWLAALALLMFAGGIASYFLLVYYAYGGLSAWLVLFATSFVAAFWAYAKVYQKVVRRHRKTGAAQNIVMTFDGGLAGKLLGIKTGVPLIAPLRHRDQQEPTKPILVFGFTAAFLPVVVFMILEVAR